MSKSSFFGIIFLKVIWTNIIFLNEQIISFPCGKCSKFYLQADLIVSRFLSDIGVPYKSQKQPPEVIYKKAVFKNFAIFTVKHLCWSLFLIKYQIGIVDDSSWQEYVIMLPDSSTWKERLKWLVSKSSWYSKE